MNKDINISKSIIILILLLVCEIGYGQIEIRGIVISELIKETPWYSYTIKPNIREHPTSFPDDSGNFLIEFLEPNKEYEIDWKNGNAQFLLKGSLAPMRNTKSDNRFEKKYNIEYYGFGCIITNYECTELYNQKMAELMDEQFG